MVDSFRLDGTLSLKNNIKSFGAHPGLVFLGYFSHPWYTSNGKGCPCCLRVTEQIKRENSMKIIKALSFLTYTLNEGSLHGL